MTRCKMLVLSILLVQTVYGQYADNPYLHGYQNDQQAFMQDRLRRLAENPYLQHAINSRQIESFMAPGYLPPVQRQQLICSGQQVCLNRNQCNNGFFTQGSPSGRQECDYETEVCCTYRPPPPPPPPPTQVPSTPCSGNDVTCVSPNYCINGVIKSNGQLRTQSSSGKCYAPEVCCRIPDSTVLTKDGYEIRVPDKPFPTPPTRPPPTPTPRRIPPPPPTRPPTRPPPPPVVPTYLPPERTTYPPPPRSTNPPRRGEDQLSPPIFPPPNRVDEPQPPVKCAAALNCTRIEFCSSTGMIVKTPVILTKEQELFRVPMTDCRDEREGFLGKCCRDPDYVDPWPVTQLGRYDANLFGDTGKYKPNGNNGRPKQPIAQPSVLSGSAILSLPIPAPQTNQIDPYQYPKPASANCVSRNQNTQPFGEGPYDANFGEYPWQAMILLESTKSLLCGGAIIAEDLVATAAHCVQGRKPFDVLIKAGEWKLGRDEEPLPFELMRVTKIESHPKYDPTTLANDMALLHLENKLKLDAHVGPICIDDREPSASEQCVTTGWGKVALRLHAQDAIMHHSPVSILQSGQCGTGNEICGQPNIDACELDNGSALACVSNGQYVMKGTSSSESQCGNAIVTFVKPDLQWINSAKGKKSASSYKY